MPTGCEQRIDVLADEARAVALAEHARLADEDIHPVGAGRQIIEVMRRPVLDPVVLDEGETSAIRLDDPAADAVVAKGLVHRGFVGWPPPAADVRRLAPVEDRFDVGGCGWANTIGSDGHDRSPPSASASE